MISLNNKEYNEKEYIIYNIDNELIDYKKLINDNIQLPVNIKIATISLSGHMNTTFNLNNILLYLEPNNEDIIAIKGNICELIKEEIEEEIKEEVKDDLRIQDLRLQDYNTYFNYTNKKIKKNVVKKKQLNIKKTMVIKCIPEYQNKFKSTNKNSKKSFYNQLTLIIKVKDGITMHIKLFNNGAIQIAGCKSFDDCNIALNKLINKLKKTYVIMDKDNNINEMSFTTLEDNKKLELINLQVDMINSNFSINYLINRETLFNLLQDKYINQKKDFTVTYDPSSHAGVIIKCNITKDELNIVSIFIFQTGKIIITGAKKMMYIIETYNFIHEFLQKNKKIIIKKDINMILKNQLSNNNSENDILNNNC